MKVVELRKAFTNQHNRQKRSLVNDHRRKYNESNLLKFGHENSMGTSIFYFGLEYIDFQNLKFASGAFDD